MEYYSAVKRKKILLPFGRVWMDVEKKEHFLYHLWECRLEQPVWKVVWRYLEKLKMDLPFDPAIPLLLIYPKEFKTLTQKIISTPMFIAALFIITKIWKQPKCPLVDKWIKQLWDIYIMEYYSAIKENKVLPFSTV